VEGRLSGTETTNETAKHLCAIVHRFQFHVFASAMQPASPRTEDHAGNSGRGLTNSAVSVQAAIPDNSIEPVTSRIAPAAVAAIGASGEISYGGREAIIRAVPRTFICPP